MTRDLSRTAALLSLVAVLGACGGGTPVGSPSPSHTASGTATGGPSASASSSPTTEPSPVPRPTSPSPSPTPTRTATPVPTQSSARPTPSARPAVPATVIWRGTTARRVMALTFDAGSDVGRTKEILDLLDAQDVTAAFGLTGAWMRANPALTQRIAAAGHLVVNHTDRHLSFTGRSTDTAPLTRTQRWEALTGADQTFRRLTGRGTTPWFRPPYGDRDDSVDRDVAALGYRFELMWSVDSAGWRGVPPAEVLRRVVSGAGPGAIVLMHVGAASTDALALPDVIRELRARGFALVRPDRF